MKKYLRLFGEINDEMMEELITFCNNLNESDEGHLFMTSGGGWASIPEQMAFIINNNDNIKDITFAWENSSASFLLLLDIIPEKRIVAKSLYGGIHLQSRDFNTNDILNIKEDVETKALLDNMQDSNLQVIAMFEHIGITNEEIKRIKVGKLVYLNYLRILNILELYDKNDGDWRNDLPRI